jgi:serine/threonine-protein kinase BUR1
VSTAKHKDSDRIYALKKILIHNENEGIPITALREIKILKSLCHPNIVNLSEIAFLKGDRANRKKGTIFMVFEYMDHDLTGLLENPNIKFTQSQIKSYVHQLLEGTTYLHLHKILHRDMKCTILMTNNRL